MFSLNNECEQRNVVPLWKWSYVYIRNVLLKAIIIQTSCIFVHTQGLDDGGSQRVWVWATFVNIWLSVDK